MGFHNTEWAEDMMSSARSRAAGKPLENNTRLYEREDGKFAVKFHAVDVVTINPDGTYTLANGGWNTVTTLQRIRQFAPVQQTLMSVQGEWYLRSEPNPKDPRPERVERTIPRPFTPGDHMGDEPVKSELGCQAGTMLGTDHVDEIVDVWRRDVKDDDEIVEDTYETKGQYDRLKVKRTWTSWIFYGVDRYDWQSKEWRDAENKENVTYQWCPHCKEFEDRHERWRRWMHGDYGDRFDNQTGYAKYIEMMTRFHNDKDLWQQGYLEDLRARRAYLKADREWDERNRVPFYDGIIVNEDGYVARLRNSGPSPAKLRRHERAVNRIKADIDKYVDGFITALKEGMPMPSGGDCWYCALSSHDGVPMGDAMDTLHEDGSVTVQPNPGHLFDHIEESYYVPSLAVNALRERGYRDVGIYIWLDMDPENGTMGKPEGNYDGVKRDIVKYLTKRMVPKAPTE